MRVSPSNFVVCLPDGGAAVVSQPFVPTLLTNESVVEVCVDVGVALDELPLLHAVSSATSASRTTSVLFPLVNRTRPFGNVLLTRGW